MPAQLPSYFIIYMFQSTGFKDALQQHVIQFLRASWNKASKCYMKVEVWGQ